MNTIIWKDKDKSWLKLNYSSNGMDYCIKKLNKSKQQIISMCQQLKLKLNKNKWLEARKKCYEYLYTDKYKDTANSFINFKTREHIYLLGFLFADGYLVIRNKTGKSRIKCIINSYDGEELKSIFLSTGKWNIHFRERWKKSWKDTLTFDISNKFLYEFLINNGYKANSHSSPNKLLSLIPYDLLHYWFLGYFDGDGHVGKNVITFTSNIKQNWSFMKKLCKNLRIKYYIYKSSYKNKKSGNLNSCSRFSINISQGNKKLIEFLYKDDTIGLKRKYNKAQTLLLKSK